MNRTDFDYWVTVLRHHFPGHPDLHDLDTTWRPNGGKGWIQGHAARIWRDLLREVRLKLP